MIVVIDPGHGGSDSGAIGLSGLLEKDVTLRLAKMLSDRMQRRPSHELLATPLMTRTDDSYVSLTERCRIANHIHRTVDRVAAFVSLHCNSFTAPAANGVEVWTSPGTTPADSLATRIWLDFRATFPERRMRLDMTDGDEDKEHPYSVLTGTVMPAVLVETAFISHYAEEQLLRDRAWLAAVAGCLDHSIDSWIRGGSA